MEALSVWDKDPIHQQILEIANRFGLKLGQLAQPLRLAMTGGVVSPPIDLTLQLIGKVSVLSRLKAALSKYA